MFNILPFVLRNLRRRKLRNWLTIAGIIVGVFAIVSLISLSEGLKESIDKEFSNLGAYKITINSKYISFGGSRSLDGLTDEDIKTVKKITDVSFISGSLRGYLETKYSNKILMVTFTSYDVVYFEDMLKQNNLELLEGRFFSNEKSREVIVGYNYIDSKKSKDQLYGKTLSIGKKISINGSDYTVIGFLKKTGDDRKDSQMYLSNENLMDIKDTKIYSSIYAIIRPGRNIEVVADRIQTRLEKSRGKKDITVDTPLDQNKRREETLGIVSIVIIGIACISLLVGGIGILNSMYTSVYERKKEIGVLMAIGAKRKDVLTIFLLESGIIGLIGGVIGLILGFSIALLIKFVAGQFGTVIAVSTNPLIAFFAMGFSFTLGILSGVLPAYNASRQEPVDSLREE
jgi:putative ABC transport system permease protein